MSRTFQALIVDLISISFWAVLGKLFGHFLIGLDIGLFVNLSGGATRQLLKK